MLHDVVVVGAGAMGSAAAWALARAGREVVVLEQFGRVHERGGSHGASRLFRLEFETPDYFRLALHARTSWRELEEESGDTLLTVTGGVDHGVGPGTVDTFRDLLGAHGVRHAVLGPEEAAERWPGMAFAAPVLHQPDAGRLHADTALAALQRLASTYGAEIRTSQPVTGLRVASADGPVEVRTPDASLRARHVVAAVGPWAPRLLAGLVELPAVTVTQEQPRVFAPLEEGSEWPAFVHWRRGTGVLDSAESYGLLEGAAGVKVGLHASGPVVDPDARSFRPDPHADDALVSYVRDWFPGLDPDRSVAVSCLYDSTATGDFVIDRVGPITLATGFSGRGFKFVPLVGGLLRDLATGDGTGPARFSLKAHRPTVQH